ncbi:hypothetical protein [Shewanella sp. Isolate11]|uniref:hypothetical protein n=1 Tax=Shewanella sp. Isolate11 TaxID=2908530 RepID=UPI001EFE3A6F|nr:hypothetical protein [Shewanella sp. Isolate11]MCG9696079.1 hypothetical protein [Shewanella sp. Isolate11]
MSYIDHSEINEFELGENDISHHEISDEDVPLWQQDDQACLKSKRTRDRRRQYQQQEDNSTDRSYRESRWR